MDQVIDIAEGANQRGGRTLSVIDLLDAGTLSMHQAAWLLDRIDRGASWLVGAKPGGAGKTTIMVALLSMLPEGEKTRLACPGTDWEQSQKGDCIVAHEISTGAFEAYIWGKQVDLFLRHGRAGRRIVSNLHADTLEEARQQIVEGCGVAPTLFDGFDIFLPITFPEGFYLAKPQIETIHYHERGQWRQLRPERHLTQRELSIEMFLKGLHKKGLHTALDVRRAWLAWLRES